MNYLLTWLIYFFVFNKSILCWADSIDPYNSHKYNYTNTKTLVLQGGFRNFYTVTFGLKAKGTSTYLKRGSNNRLNIIVESTLVSSRNSIISSKLIVCVCVCACPQCVVCAATAVSVWVSGLKESQVSQCCSTIPSLFDEETSCKIDVNLKVRGSSFGACSDQCKPAAHYSK